MIHLKSEHQIERMKKSGQIVARIFQMLSDYIAPGVTTWDINTLAHDHIIQSGATPSFLNYGNPPFPASVCTSVNYEVVHGIPSKARTLSDGDIVSVDIGAYLDGFHADAARTFIVGRAPKEIAQLVKVTEESFWKGIEKARVGGRIGDISSAIQRHAESFGFGVVRQLVGHGIGQDLHEDPDVPNFGKSGRGLRLQEGMALAIEPMINIGVAEICMMPDQWTIATADRLFSSHYENTIIITSDGPVVTTILEDKRQKKEDRIVG